MAEKKFFVDINLQGSALKNAKIGTNTGIGSTEGAFGFDSASHRLQYFDGTATKDVANLSDISAVTGGLIFQGGYDPTTDTPDITDGTALKGFLWVATAAGTFLGESVQVGDSIVAKVDYAGATIADWLILQGNIVIATDSVDGISRLATQAEADAGTEGGAVVITPATLQGKIDAQITPEISSKLSLTGGTMSGDIDMNNSAIVNITEMGTSIISGNASSIIDVYAGLNFNTGFGIQNLPAPTDGGDATNKTYVDGAAATAESNANDYADTGLATKLDLAGGIMSGNLNMGNNIISAVNTIQSYITTTDNLQSAAANILLYSDINAQGTQKITGLAAPTDGGDAANKDYVDTAAATAESNANDYTDARSTAVFVATGDWVLDGTVYIFVIQNVIDGNLMINTVYENRPAEFEYFNSNGTIYLYSNVLPTSQVQVNIMKVS